MKIAIAAIAVAIVVVCGLAYILIQPSVNARLNEQTAVTTSRDAGPTPQMSTWSPPSGNTKQNLSGVPDIETYPSAENGG